MKLDALKLGYAGAIISAACMFLLSIFGSVGFYGGAMTQMMKWHMYYSPSVFGIFAGMIEAALITFVLLYALAFIYNWLLENSK